MRTLFGIAFALPLVLYLPHFTVAHMAKAKQVGYFTPEKSAIQRCQSVHTLVVTCLSGQRPKTGALNASLFLEFLP